MSQRDPLIHRSGVRPPHGPECYCDACEAWWLAGSNAGRLGLPSWSSLPATEKVRLAIVIPALLAVCMFGFVTLVQGC